MMRLLSLCAAATLVVACSESTDRFTAPPLDLAPSYAKPADAGTAAAGNLTNDNFNFNDESFTSVAGTSFTVEDLAGGFGAAAPTFAGVFNAAANRFIGRLGNHKVGLVVTNGGSRFTVNMDLYIIGSWDGDGQQSGKQYGADVWEAAVACAATGPSVATLLRTSFSNQKTVQQSYPDSYDRGRGGGPAFTGAYAVDALGFINDPTSHTPQDMSAGDSWYKLSFSGANPCGNGSPLFLAFTVPNETLQSNYDESWGIDNVLVMTDS